MPRRSKKKQYSFPVLTKQEIIICFAELGINVSNSNLNKPDEQTCRYIFCESLQSLMSINVNRKVAQKENNYFEYPSLHQQSIMNIRLFRDVIRFMVKIGVIDFGINDIIFPESKRTIRNLSAIINFAKFRNQKYRIYQQYNTQITELQQKLDQKTKENQALASEFIRIKSKIDEDKPMVDNLQNQMLELHTEIITANDEMEEQGTTIHSIKKEIKSLQATQKEKAALLNKNVDEIRFIKSQIVNSPQRIKRELKAMSKHVEMAQIEVAKKQIIYRDDCKKLEAYKELKRLVKERIGEMEDTEKTMKQYNENKVAMDELKSDKRSLMRVLHGMKESHKKTKRKLAAKKENYQALQIEKETKLETVNKLYAQIDETQDLRMRENLEKQKQIIEYDQQIEQIQREKDKLLKHHNKNINDIARKYKELGQAVDEYHKNVKW